MKIENMTIHGGSQQFEGGTGKIIIENIVAKMEGGTETELEPTDTIRFEIGKDTYRISIKDNAINIYKSSDSLDGSILIIPEHSNVISIK